MPNNNIGLAMVFRRFSSMHEDDQKQYVSKMETFLMVFNIVL